MGLNWLTYFCFLFSFPIAFIITAFGHNQLFGLYIFARLISLLNCFLISDKAIMGVLQWHILDFVIIEFFIRKINRNPGFDFWSPFWCCAFQVWIFYQPIANVSSFLPWCQMDLLTGPPDTLFSEMILLICLYPKKKGFWFFAFILLPYLMMFDCFNGVSALVCTFKLEFYICC